jgi:membrane protein implicated in regulation of membrane protease activity
VSYLSALTGIEIWALWAVIAVGLLIFEALTAIGFFISFSASGFGVAVWAYFNPSTASGSELWQWLGFSAFGLVLYFPIRMAMKKFVDGRSDISDY